MCMRLALGRTISAIRTVHTADDDALETRATVTCARKFKVVTLFRIVSALHVQLVCTPYVCVFECGIG